MKKYIYLSLTLFVIYSCKNNTNTETSNEEDNPIKLTYKEHHISSDKLEACKDSICPTIDIKYITFEEDSPLAKNINRTIDDNIISIFSIDPDQKNKIKTQQEGITNFISQYREFKTEFPEADTKYELSSSSSITHDSDSIVSITTETYSYWGGAHGYGSVSYQNFDKKNAAHLDLNALLSDSKEFMALAEKTFRAQKGIPEDTNINSTGYFFDEDTFILPQNIGFDQDKMVLTYNPYEVAPYAEGQIVIHIPLEKVKEVRAIIL